MDAYDLSKEINDAIVITPDGDPFQIDVIKLKTVFLQLVHKIEMLEKECGCKKEK